MRRVFIVVLVGLVLRTSSADAAPGAGCLRASGAAAVQCLAGYTTIVEECLERGDTGCDTSAEPLAAAVEAVRARVDPADGAACTEADASALGFSSAADVALRSRNACGDYGESLVDVAHPGAPGPPGAELAACQHLVASRLDRLRDATIRLFGPGCYLRERRGQRCLRTQRNHRLSHVRAVVRRSIARGCGSHLAGLGLDPLDDVLARTVTLARHYAQQVYPPNDLGPSAEFGPLPVGIRTLALTDPTRPNLAGGGPRPVTVEVYYPSTAAAVAGVPHDVATVLGIPVVVTPAYRDVALAPGRHPLVVFSHGSDGIRIQSFFFAAHLASHGFVVASPDHHGNTFPDMLMGIVDPDVAVNRPRDVSFVIDRLLAFNEQTGNFFADAIDPARIGASGHSFGGYTVLALAGDGAFTDARVKAILPQAPAAVFSDAHFATIHVPTLIVGGSIDSTTPFAENQQRPYDLLPTGAAVVALAELTDAGHFTFSDFCEVDRRLLAFLGGFREACEPRHLPWRHAHDIVNYLSLNFFAATLNGDRGALARLRPKVVHRIEDLTYWRK